MASAAGSSTGSLILWVAGGLITLCGALTMAELAAMFPRPGGTYVYLREAYGDGVAFVFGWTRLLLIQPAVLGGIAVIFGAYAQALIPLSGLGVRVVAASALVILALANLRSVGLGAAIQNASTAAKVIALIGLAAAAFALGEPAEGGLLGSRVTGSTTASGLGIALIAVLWSYDGWAELLYAAGEVKRPQRTVPAALLIGSLVVVAVYLVVNAAFLYVLALDEVAASELVASDAATRIFGPVGASIVAALVMLSTFGALNGALLGGPRVFFAMARDRVFFARIGAVHPRYQTPYAAIALAALLGVGYVSLRTFEQLVEAFILGIWPFYVLVVAGVFRLRRRRPDLTRPYRTFGYPVVPWVFLLASGAMLVNALVTQPASAAFSFGIVLLGAPVYLIWRTKIAP